MRSGIRAPPASGRRCGSSAWPRPTSTGSAGRRTSTSFAIALRGAHRRRPVDDLAIEVTLRARRARCWRDDRYQVVDREVDRRIVLSDPGIDDFRNELLWSPERPTLLDATRAPAARRRGASTSSRSYTALRSVVDPARPLHAQRPALPAAPGARPGLLARHPARGADDDALRRDVELAKAMGFNGVRKHQKIEDPRYLYWADRLGLLVWEEMPSAYRFTRTAIKRTIREWTRGDRARLQPSLHHRLGAVQRILGRARADRRCRRSATPSRRSTT